MLVIPGGLDFSAYDFTQAGEPHRLSDYAPGEIIDHVDGVTIEEAEHMMATRLWQNTSKTHFDATPREDRKRLIYGGHVMSMARALSFNGLANAQCIVAINAGSHANPCFAGDTVRAWSEVLDTAQTPAPRASARSACGWWRPRTGQRSARSRARMANTCRTSCSTSTTGR
jgi:2-methylfumaryl-CoA hydratase